MSLPSFPFLYVDAFSGVSGDMFLAALVDLGYPIAQLRQDVAALGVPGIDLRRRRVKRGGLAALRVEVRTAGKQPHRGRAQIRALLRQARLEPTTRRLCRQVFDLIVDAEARLHGMSPEKVHLHEVGALDALADVVGTVSALQRLGVGEIQVSPVNVGGGTALCDHGRLPVPTPATAALLQGIPVYSRGDHEKTTPTGAALLRVLASGFGPLPLARIDGIGQGAGDRDDSASPNLLRLLAGERLGQTVPADGGKGIVEIQCQLDDMEPRLFGYLMERLLEEGARDVFTSPAMMKKGRPGTLVVVLADADRAGHLGTVLLEETPTLGYRVHPVERVERQRRHVRVQTPYGPVRIKVAADAGPAVATPEYDDCQRQARAQQVPLRLVLEAAQQAWSRHSKSTPTVRKKK